MVGALHNPEPNEDRGRLVRSEENRRLRRRRTAGSLNRMQQMTLDIFDPDQLDPNYVYRWVEDKPGRIRAATMADDYDFVDPSTIKGWDDTQAEAQLRTESTRRLKQVVGENRHGPIEAYLLRKPRWMWEEDQEEIAKQRQERLERRVLKGEFTNEGAGYTDKGAEDRPVENVYVTPGNRVGSPGQRRRGPITP